MRLRDGLPRLAPPHGQHCVTCADEGVEVTVLAPDQGGLARCTDGASEREVDATLVGRVTAGDRLLVHAGVAIARVTGGDEA